MQLPRYEVVYIDSHQASVTRKQGGMTTCIGSFSVAIADILVTHLNAEMKEAELWPQGSVELASADEWETLRQRDRDIRQQQAADLREATANAIHARHLDVIDALIRNRLGV